MGRTEPGRSAGGKKLHAQALPSPPSADGSPGPSWHAQSQGLPKAQALVTQDRGLEGWVSAEGWEEAAPTVEGSRWGRAGQKVSGLLLLPKGPTGLSLPSRSGVLEASSAKQGALDEESTSSQLHNRPSPGFPLPTFTMAMIVTGLQARSTATGVGCTWRP